MPAVWRCLLTSVTSKGWGRIAPVPSLPWETHLLVVRVVKKHSQKMLRRELTAIIDYFSFTSPLQLQRTKILLFSHIRGHLPTFPSYQAVSHKSLCLSSPTFALERTTLFLVYTLDKYALWGLPFNAVSKGISQLNLTFYSLINS